MRFLCASNLHLGLYNPAKEQLVATDGGSKADPNFSYPPTASGTYYLREADVPVLELSRATVRKMHQNLWWAVGYSLAFSGENEPGWRRFMATVEDAVRWLGSKVVDAETFEELVKHLDDQWTDHDDVVRTKREEAARALLHAEQRNLLAQKLAAETIRQMRYQDGEYLFIDNFDSFTFNLVESFERLGCDIKVLRNSVAAEVAFALAQSRGSLIVLSPGPGTSKRTSYR